ncbi:DUF945 family protein [Erwinia sp. MYb535]|uniref:DUF945 family protein n=1 Tax=Erwinia sp. MYb535 TaxID=2745309 RepID=UPI00403F7BEC
MLSLTAGESAWITASESPANAQIQNTAPESRLKLSYQDFQRGVFSSHARFVLQSSSQTEDNSILKPGH